MELNLIIAEQIMETKIEDFEPMPALNKALSFLRQEVDAPVINLEQLDSAIRTIQIAKATYLKYLNESYRFRGLSDGIYTLARNQALRAPGNFNALADEMKVKRRMFIANAESLIAVEHEREIYGL